MKNLFQNSSSHWVRYSEYELKEGGGWCPIRYTSGKGDAEDLRPAEGSGTDGAGRAKRGDARYEQGR